MVREVFMKLKDKTQSLLGYEVRFEVLPAFQVRAASAKALRWQYACHEGWSYWSTMSKTEAEKDK